MPKDPVAIGSGVHESMKKEVPSAKSPPMSILTPFAIKGETSSLTSRRSKTHPYEEKTTAKNMAISGREKPRKLPSDNSLRSFAKMVGRNPINPMDRPTHFKGVIFSLKWIYDKSAAMKGVRLYKKQVLAAEI